MTGFFQFLAGYFRGTTMITVKQGGISPMMKRSLLRKIKSEDDFVKFQLPWII